MVMTHDEAVAWWLNQAPTYFTDMEFFFTRPDLIAKFNLTPKSFVLELGFGYGRELSQFCKITPHAYGLELSQVTCDLATEKCREQEVENLPTVTTYDGRFIPLPGAAMDFVYSCFLLQHMSKANAKALVREALRVTRPGGSVLMEFFGDPEFHHPTDDCFSGNPSDGTGMFNNAYTRAEIEAMDNVVWVDEQPISTFSNFWGCFQP